MKEENFCVLTQQFNKTKDTFFQWSVVGFVERILIVDRIWYWVCVRGRDNMGLRYISGQCMAHQLVYYLCVCAASSPLSSPSPIFPIPYNAFRLKHLFLSNTTLRTKALGGRRDELYPHKISYPQNKFGLQHLTSNWTTLASFFWKVVGFGLGKQGVFQLYKLQISDIFWEAVKGTF